MKMILTIAAAAVMATAAGAQMTGPTDPSATGTGTMQTMPPADATTPQPDMSTPPAAVATPSATPGSLVQRDGKWWNGDREATKAEIADYKKMKKAGKPG